MRFHFSQLLLSVALLSPVATAQTTQPTETTKTFTAVRSLTRWDGWAKSSKSIPGWGNTPPEAGTVTITDTPAGQPRVFSGRVDGLDTVKGAEVGVVSLAYIYWIRKDTYHWVPVADDGTFTITDEKYLDENKAVVLRAPGHPWSYFSYIFKTPEGGKDIRLHAEPGKAIRITVDVAGTPSKDFGVEFFALNKAWVHENNPIGYQWGSHLWTPDNSDGSMTLYFPLHPIALYLSAEDGANDWQIVDAREADHFHFVLLPAACFKVTVMKNGVPLPKVDVSMGNENAALSLRSGQTDTDGKWGSGGMAPGRWWLKIAKKTVEFDIEPKETVEAKYDVATGQLETK